MACPSCKYGDDCCEGVWLDVKDALAHGDLGRALIQAAGRMCLTCFLRAKIEIRDTPTKRPGRRSEYVKKTANRF